MMEKIKSNKEASKRRRRNRIKIVRFTLSLIMIGVSINMFFKIEDEMLKKESIKEKNSFLLSKSFLIRENEFYKDESYQKEFFLTKKDWIEDKGGLIIDERDKEEG